MRLVVIRDVKFFSVGVDGFVDGDVGAEDRGEGVEDSQERMAELVDAIVDVSSWLLFFESWVCGMVRRLVLVWLEWMGWGERVLYGERCSVRGHCESLRCVQ